MYPLKLAPVFKDYIWGGTRLRDDFGKNCDFDRIAESWELSCHKDGASVIFNGEYAGKTLAEYINENKAVLGTNCERFEQFPVLIKLIDAKNDLSVQVHPDDEYSRRTEGEYGKTEMWYIVDCDPGAKILYGFTKEVSKEEFAERIRNNTLLEITKSVPVKKGDVFFIEAGTLHAVGKGILVAEIQQNSNTTYRIYDYGRVGADGKPRQLHIDKAADVTKLSPPKSCPAAEAFAEGGAVKRLLSKCEYFTVYAVEAENEAFFDADETSFHNILVLEGYPVLECDGAILELTKGDSVFVPAGCGEYTLTGAFKGIFTRIG